MRRLRTPLAALALLGGQASVLASPVNDHRVLRYGAGFADVSRGGGESGVDDKKQDSKQETVETRLLRILKERGVLTQGEFDELNKLGAEMRAEELKARGDIDAALRDLSTQIRDKANQTTTQQSKRGKYEVVYDKGFVLRPLEPETTPFEMRINGRVQMRATYMDPTNKTWTDRTGKVTPMQTRDDIEIERGRLTFSGYMLDTRLEYFLNFDMDSDDGHVAIAHDYWIDYRFADEFILYAGKAFIPGSRDWLNGAMMTRFTDRSLATTFFRPDRTVGIWAEGELVRNTLWYRTMVGNGFAASDITPDNLDNRGMVSGSVWTDPLAPYGRGYSDLEGHHDLAVRAGSSFTYAGLTSKAGGGSTAEEAWSRTAHRSSPRAPWPRARPSSSSTSRSSPLTSP
jgi:hypothetical protein